MTPAMYWRRHDRNPAAPRTDWPIISVYLTARLRNLDDVPPGQISNFSLDREIDLEALEAQYHRAKRELRHVSLVDRQRWQNALTAMESMIGRRRMTDRGIEPPDRKLTPMIDPWLTQPRYRAACGSPVPCPGMLCYLSATGHFPFGSNELDDKFWQATHQVGLSMEHATGVMRPNRERRGWDGTGPLRGRSPMPIHNRSPGNAYDILGDLSYLPND
jgi:hypothetical protein